jgi:hypothetical protein
MKAEIEAMPWWNGTRVLRAYRRAESTFPWNWHYHPEIELTLITCGSGTRLVGDHSGDYKSGDLVLLGPNLPHTWFSRKTGRTATANEAIVVQFLESAFPRTLLELPEFDSIRTLLLRSAMGVRFSSKTADRLEKQMRALTKADGFEAWLKLARLLHELSQADAETLVEQLKNKHHLPLTAESTQFINNLVMKEYLAEFRGHYTA